MPKINANEVVIVVLHSPREKIWGIVDEINVAGIFVRGIDLNAFDDWIRAINRDEGFFGLSDSFIPMWRVERILRDEGSDEIPSLYEQFERRTNRKIDEF